MRIDTLTTYIYKNSEGGVLSTASPRVSPTLSIEKSQLNLARERESATDHIISFLEERKKRRRKQNQSLTKSYQAIPGEVKGLHLDIYV